jgi:hypothetical protein
MTSRITLPDQRPTLLAVAIAVLSSCTGPDVGPPGAAVNALTSEQCNYFDDENGRVTLCHKTASETFPYALVRVSDEACEQGHSDHPDDFVLAGGDCSAPTCLSADAPCDGTLGCCAGFECVAGQCIRACGEVGDTCDPSSRDCCNSSCYNGRCTDKCTTGYNCDDSLPCCDGMLHVCLNGKCTSVAPPPYYCHKLGEECHFLHPYGSPYGCCPGFECTGLYPYGGTCIVSPSP